MTAKNKKLLLGNSYPLRKTLPCWFIKLLTEVLGKGAVHKNRVNFYLHYFIEQSQIAIIR